MAETIKHLYGWVVGIGAGAWGLMSQTDLLTLLGVLVAVATVCERMTAWKRNKAQEALALAKIDQIRAG